MFQITIPLAREASTNPSLCEHSFLAPRVVIPRVRNLLRSRLPLNAVKPTTENLITLYIVEEIPLSKGVRGMLHSVYLPHNPFMNFSFTIYE